MPCDPNTLLADARCLEACIPTQMLPAVQTSLLCQILDAGGGGGGGGAFVLKSGDAMTGKLTIDSVGGDALEVVDSSNPTSRSLFTNTGLTIYNEADGVTSVFIAENAGSIGFFGAIAGKQTSGANLTNNVTVGGVNDTIADFTSLAVYATDAATIRNDIYQLARKLKQINDGLRAYGLFT